MGPDDEIFTDVTIVCYEQGSVDVRPVASALTAAAGGETPAFGVPSYSVGGAVRMCFSDIHLVRVRFFLYFILFPYFFFILFLFSSFFIYSYQYFVAFNAAC